MKEEKKKCYSTAKKPASISMSEKLKDKIQKAADKDGRSFSDYACRILEQHV